MVPEQYSTCSGTQSDAQQALGAKKWCFSCLSLVDNLFFPAWYVAVTRKRVCEQLLFWRHWGFGACAAISPLCKTEQKAKKLCSEKTVCEERKCWMSEDVQRYLNALNSAWQRYARLAEGQPESALAEALNKEYLVAWEGLDACGIAEWMLVYDAPTLTFALPVTEEDFATKPLPALPRRR